MLANNAPQPPDDLKPETRQPSATLKLVYVDRGLQGSRRLLIQKPLETFPISSGLPRSATASAIELWYLRREQRSQFFLIEFIDADAHVM
jgi:hypothetical protein